MRAFRLDFWNNKKRREEGQSQPNQQQQQQQQQSGQLPACRMRRKQHENKNATCVDDNEDQKIIVIGDIHGEYNGFLEILHAANVTSARDECSWKHDADSMLLVQVGDLVDRGPEAHEAWACLDHLQETAEDHKNSKVVRLVGNHELWWLEGAFHMRNQVADTSEKVFALVAKMKQQIINKSLVAAHTVTRSGGVDLLFVHAGYRPAFLATKQNQSAAALSEHINSLLIEQTQQCLKMESDTGRFVKCAYNGEEFEAGPERGGKHIGGPIWTDFKVLEAAAVEASSTTLNVPFIQIVGHTAAHCYDDNDHSLPAEIKHCDGEGFVRATKRLEAVCVDGGMYMGTQSFLMIDTNNNMLAYEQHGFDGGEWIARNMNEAVCGPLAL